jgi:Putative Zn-dependent protease, contains TPR repeats
MSNKTWKILKIVFAMLAISVCIVAIQNRSFRGGDIRQQIKEVRKKTQPKFDSISRLITQENNFHNNVLFLIEAKQLDSAGRIVDSAINKNPAKHILYTYKGMIYARLNNHLAAIEQFNKSMARYQFPLALVHRAESFLELNKFDSAIVDYKKAAEYNYDFNYQIAQAYEQRGLLDSAVIYYTIYLNHYPQKTEIREHLGYLSGMK